MGGRLKAGHDTFCQYAMTGLLSLAPFADFAAAFDVDRYSTVPDGWFVAVSDVIDSTAAIKSGRYKDVNMAGAATIASVLNACGRDDLPFSFAAMAASSHPA